MGSIVNGMSLSDLRPYGATFFIFSDYMRPPIRLAAMMDIPAIFIYTHDSICLGEDGPTHQPIEQLMSLAGDSAAAGLPSRGCQRGGRDLALHHAAARRCRCCWRLTRQAVPTFDRTKYASAAGVAKGAYIMADSGGTPDVILIGTGSEVQLCVGAYEKLTAEGVKARVVSMPCWKLFERAVGGIQAAGPAAGGAGASRRRGRYDLGWSEYVGPDGRRCGHGRTSAHRLLSRTC